MITRRTFSSLAVAGGLSAMAGGLPEIARAEDGLTVVWGEDQNGDALYDPRITQSRHEKQVIVQVFDTLVAEDGEGKDYPGLAKSWEINDDATAIRMVLRDDVTFHDGTKFDAEAVKFTFDTIVDPATASQAAIDIIGPYDRTEVISPTELVVHFKRAYPAMLAALASYELAPVSPTAVKTLGNEGFAQAPVGTGPFKFDHWDKGTEVVMLRNDAYNWAPEFYDTKGPSAVAKIVHRFIPNAATRVAALEAGEVTLSDLTPPLDMRRLGGSKKYRTAAGVVAGVPYSMMFNTSHGALQDADLRKAIMMSVDRKKLADNLFFGFANPAYGPLSKTTPDYWSGVEDYYKYDFDGAKALLDKAGWAVGADGIRVKDGQRASIHYISLLEPEVGVALQAELKKLGVELDVDNVTKARQDELIMSNDFDMGAIRWVSLDPSILRIPFYSDNIPGPGKFKFNWMFYDSPELDAQIDAAASAPTLAAQKDAYMTVQKTIMDAAIFWPLHDQVQTVAYSAKITGVKFAPGQWQVRLYDVRAAE